MWFSNGILKLERKFSDKKRAQELSSGGGCGLFEEGARRFRLDFQFHLLG
ncbi:MAG: hypothetical protein WA667_11385 [Candidatus Nitrosopolaris sp.]